MEGLTIISNADALVGNDRDVIAMGRANKALMEINFIIEFPGIRSVELLIDIHTLISTYEELMVNK